MTSADAHIDGPRGQAREPQAAAPGAPACDEGTPAAGSLPAVHTVPARARALLESVLHGDFLTQLSKYFGVSFTQTFVEFGVFAALHGLGLAATVANVFALACSASYNFLMNRNITFRASSNFRRSVALFVLLVCWNLLFSSTCLHVVPATLGWSTTLVKLLTMGCQGCWGFLLCRYVIFK